MEPRGVPSRFGLSSFLLATAALALVLAILRALNAPFAVMIEVALFVPAVASAQIFLFQGKNPRLASVIGGMLVTGLISIGSDAYFIFQGEAIAFVARSVPFLVNLFTGGVTGYLIGLVLGLMAHAVDWVLKHRR